MIDLHCHMLPGIDDGAPDQETALAMARIAVADGIEVTACTPHITPGRYDNRAASIHQSVTELQQQLDAEGIALRLTGGADAYLSADLLDRLRDGSAPTLHRSRYFLLEPSHHVAPPGFEESIAGFVAAGFVPIITHPERLSWINTHYEVFRRIALGGAWLQVTAGSLTGRFGEGARYWGERMLDEGLVHILATDAHGMRRRTPRLAEGRDAAEKYVGKDEAQRLVRGRPQSVLDDAAPGAVAPIPALSGSSNQRKKPGLWQRITGQPRKHVAQ